MPSVTTSSASGGTAIAAASGCSRLALEARCPDDVAALPQAVEERGVSPGVERLGGALAVEEAERDQRDVGQVEAVHRHVRRAHPAPLGLGNQPLGVRRLAGAGRAGDADDPSASWAKSGSATGVAPTW